MNVTIPDWLAQRAGSLQTGSDGRSCFVVFDQQPQYRLVPTPVAGQFGCAITQTINGKRVESSGTYATAAEALRGGLEDLRKALGW